MNYEYKTVEVSSGYDVDRTIQDYAKDGWRLHSVLKNSQTNSGTINRSDLNNSNLSLYTNHMFLLIFEKKAVMLEIKDIMNDTAE